MWALNAPTVEEEAEQHALWITPQPEPTWTSWTSSVALLKPLMTMVMDLMEMMG